MNKIWSYHQLPIDECAVLYEASDGQGILDNPRALFESLLSNPKYERLHHIWVLAPEWMAAIEDIGPWSNHPRVHFVEYKSDQYFERLATSKYLINNTSFPHEFVKREGQVYVNTWHGIPLKRMGYDVPDGHVSSRNILRNFLSADYILSACPWMTQVMYRDAYKLETVFPGRILETGQPRTDAHKHVSREEALEELRAAGVLVDGRKVILYAPTWRGASFSSPDYDCEELIAVQRAIQDAVDPDEYQVLLKVHQFVARVADDNWRLRGLMIPQHVPTNIALAATDVLITDYSSIFFDFLSLDRPIIFYTPDLDNYVQTRGLYLDVDDWPGPVVSSLDLLASALVMIDEDRIAYHRQRSEWLAKFCPFDDGQATERVVGEVFGGENGGAPARAVSLSMKKSQLLIYAGGFFQNGITTSLLALLNALDYQQFDVSILYNLHQDESRRLYAAKVPPQVRHIVRVGTMVQRHSDRRRRKLFESRGLAAPAHVISAQKENFGREWRRCLGDAKFDHVIDFSGYSPFWSFLCLQGPDAKRSIWVHNVLAREVEKSSNGKRIHASALPAIFSMYHQFDNIVSVSDELCQISIRDLGCYAPRRAFRSASNMVDFQKLYATAGYEVETEPGGGVILRKSSLESRLSELANEFGWEQLAHTISRRQLQDTYIPNDQATTFVTAARLSPEKNHERLLRAFARVHQTEPRTRLIIFGDGPLRQSLEGLVRTLGLSSSCSLPGHVDDVMSVVDRADCFVFSSDYEGQGLALLEAAILGKPVVTTRFDVVTSVLPDGVGLIVEPTIDDLARGMMEFLEGRVGNARVDPVDYNKRALDQFLDLVAGAQEPAPELAAAATSEAKLDSQLLPGSRWVQRAAASPLPRPVSQDDYNDSLGTSSLLQGASGSQGQP